ncbi:MAG: undecaprenyldiphospho-muramoylpentapeptide beta-N-acetylglucosaminyltransferase [Desulfovibrionaceae bacterium]
MKKTLFVSTGGTAGHIFPAIAFIQELQDSFPNIHVIFIAGARKEDKNLVEQYGITCTALPVRGVMGKNILQKGIALFFLLYSLLLAFTLCLRKKPIACVGFGGYACFPSVFAASVLGIPTILHEQNSVPGKANLLLAKFVDTVCISFPSSKIFFKKNNVTYTGNPVRKSLLRHTVDTQKKSCKNILILGGSLGAKQINSFVLEIAHELLEQGFSLYHQTGASDFQRVEKCHNALFLRNPFPNVQAYRIQPFIQDMLDAYSWADFSLCRSGASTISELIAMNVPAIFIPFPFAIHNHQWHNASSLVQEDLALCLEEQSLTSNVLLENIIAFANNNNLTRIRSQLYTKESCEAAKKIVSILEKFIHIH